VNRVRLAELLHFTNGDTAAEQHIAYRIDILDDKLRTLGCARLAERHPFADHHGARRSRRSHLYDPHPGRRPGVVVEAEANLVNVEGLGNIDVRHRNADDFEFHIHDLNTSFQ
jgi:hypothetical protein